MGKFSDALAAFMEQSSNVKYGFERHVPDELYGKIDNMQEFCAFMGFVAQNLETDRLEFGCENTADFVERLGQCLRDPVVEQMAVERGINHELGLVAYSFVIALGNA